MNVISNQKETSGGKSSPAEEGCTGCGFCVTRCISHQAGVRLREAGLRPTRQRIDLARILFSGEDRHFTADMLWEEASRKDVSVSLATVYNTLQQFTGAGLIRRLATDGRKTWFDTNLSDHHHLFFAEEDFIVDIPRGCVVIDRMPQVPEGMEVERVEVVVRLRRKQE
jgi:Fur family iron response transcriptional regulator